MAQDQITIETTGVKDEVNDNPIEEVRLTVPTTDDPTLPCLTFRTWMLGIICCACLSFLTQFLGYRQNSVRMSKTTIIIAILAVGKFLAKTLPEKSIAIPLTNWSFSLNPGPFTSKEHCLISILINSGSTGPAGLHLFILMKAYYHHEINPLVVLLLTIVTSMMGYGWAGIFRGFLVDSPYMWWPYTLTQVSFFHTLNDVEIRKKGRLTKLQFFVIASILSFAYYIVPNYLFPSISYLSFICWIWKDSVIAQQLGGGFNGLGLGSFAIDWASWNIFGSPLATPGFVIINCLIGYIMFMYILVPVSYWSNFYNWKRFPLMSSDIFAADGTPYNATRILNHKTFDLNYEAYNSYSKIYLGTVFAYSTGISFAVFACTLTHVVLFHWREIWNNIKTALQKKNQDVHTKLMRKNYASVPHWWFCTILVFNIGVAILSCEGFGRQLQLPWWGVLFSTALGFVFTLPIGTMQATTGQSTDLHTISDIVIGYMMPGKPLAAFTFKTLSTNSLAEATTFLSDFKLGHYMKIPPKSMFLVQVVGTLINTMISYGTFWWMFTSIGHLCDKAMLPKGSPWICPAENISYSTSIIWGVVGPLRVFGKLGVYPQLYYFFLFGLLAPLPIWLFSLKFPEKKWIKLIYAPIIIGVCESMPLAKAVHYNCWFIVGIFFSVYIFKKHKGWWSRYNYILSIAMDSGIAFLALFCAITLQMRGIYGPNWWGLQVGDHCPLASCPTSPDILVHGCPVF